MHRGFIWAIAAGLLAPGAAIAQERIDLNVVYPLNQEVFPLHDGVYFRQDNRGFYEVVEGPLDGGVARCIGAGFAGRGVNTVEGICIIGEQADTFTLRWSVDDSGLSNNWTIVAGTGRFEGASGDGIATSGVEIMYRAMPMRQTHIVGMIAGVAE
ncbi:hypothetical protein [Gymnodinialimonas ceratoperidinii]|uniref:Uncharacterized protein n=1 Tax=Gymnodinialimonas ceratoperidinii TaxID=2856823 RepID=A0A8F6TV39_9RHOB|nr:hypothetical protein [Gymnodinialimonas ceratoperidinii]QXT39240.1 hypothetical protein KYE46_15135 [Gymnodinialimonas ceratoperidinii]